MASSVELAASSTVASSSNTESPSEEQLDAALTKIWTRIQLASEESRPKGAKLSEVMQLPNPSAKQIREWFKNEEPAEVCDISALDCKELGLDVLPPEICEFDQLEFLGLQNNSLTKLPSAISKLSNLVWLHLHRNNLTSLPPELGQLQWLRALNAPNNQLRSIPAELSQLSELEVLDLSNNLLTGPFKISDNWELLKTLSLSNNRITGLVGCKKDKLEKLKTLDLDGNPLLFRLNKDLSKRSDGDNLVPWAAKARYEACANRLCRTPLAALCQAVHYGQNPEILREQFEKLSKELQGKILKHIPQPDDYLADEAAFVEALIIVLKQEFQALTESEKQRVYEQVAVFFLGKDASDTPLSKRLAEENVIHLIDAMEMAKSGKPPEILREQFEKLSNWQQDQILKHISVDQSQPSGDYLADEAAFVKALIIELEGNFQSLTISEKQRVYKQAALFPGKNASDLLNKTLAEENVIHLIDAMEMVKK